MEYSITQNFIQKNRSHQPFSPIGMVVHETATPNATDEAERNYFNNNDIKASVHAFVDYDSITQTLPWDEICWGAGYTANRRFVQVELCHFDGERFTEVWNRGVWLFAWVFINELKIYTVTDFNLMSHQEVSARWGETDHTDPYGFFADNGKTVDEFRSAVQVEIDRQLKGVDDVPEWMQKIMDRSVAAGLIEPNKHNPNENATKWFVLGIALAILKIMGRDV